ncbi:MAG: LVIVD repeat-containing protein [Candidatus Heimdallarchaeaceae archaeon]
MKFPLVVNQIFSFFTVFILIALFSTSSNLVLATSNYESVEIIELGQILTGGSAVCVEVIDDIAYLTDDFTGFHIIDVSSPADPVELAFENIPNSYFFDLDMDSNRAYVTSLFQGLFIYDISDPTNPIEIGRFNDDRTYSQGIIYKNNLVYIADGNDGLEII